MFFALALGRRRLASPGLQRPTEIWSGVENISVLLIPTPRWLLTESCDGDPGRAVVLCIAFIVASSTSIRKCSLRLSMSVGLPLLGLLARTKPRACVSLG